MARSGRQDHRLGVHRDELLGGTFVALHDDRLAAEALDQLDEVVGERVVVVDDEDHGAPCGIGSVRAGAGGGATAGRSAAAFAFVSRSSNAGSLSATIPAPLCTEATPSFTTTVLIVMQKSRSPANVR